MRDIIATTEKQTGYKAFGLRFSSGILLPELPRYDDEADHSDADVVIEAADLTGLWEEADMRDNNFVMNGSKFLFQIPETAMFCIEGGIKITVSPLPGADELKVRVYLLGTCMGALLMMRRLLPLHGSAVVIDGKAYAIVGDSGAGKSTLAAALRRQGHRLLSDDVIAVSFAHDDGIPLAIPSYPQQKLWQESIDHLGMESGHYHPVYQETTKYAVPVSSDYCPEPVPLAGVFELVKSERDKIGIAPMQILERLRILLMHTYRNILIHRLGLQQWHFSTAANIANQINVYQLHRPAEAFTVQDLASEIISKAAKGEKIK